MAVCGHSCPQNVRDSNPPKPPKMRQAANGTSSQPHVHSCLVQMLSRALENAKKFSPLPCTIEDETKKTIQSTMAVGYATIYEGLLLSALLSTNVPPEEKKKKINTNLKRVREQAEALSEPIQPHMLGIILEEASRFVLT